MSHRFRFSRDSLTQLKRFVTGHQPAEALGEQQQTVPETPETQPEAPETPPSPFLVAARTDIGKVRSSNQDALIEGDRLWGVADGMGGHNGGETASSGARDGLLALLDGHQPSLDGLRASVQTVNHRLFLQQQENEKLSGMGTTLTMLWFGEQDVYIAHVGDSRAYLLRDGQMKQITNDHSLVAELVRSGHLTSEQAEQHPMRNVITRAVGTEATIDVDLITEERRAGDLWLICSDGLHGQVSDHSMQAILTMNEPDAAAGLLLESALSSGGPDNISLIVLLDREGGHD